MVIVGDQLADGDPLTQSFRGPRCALSLRRSEFIITRSQERRMHLVIHYICTKETLTIFIPVENNKHEKLKQEIYDVPD